MADKKRKAIDSAFDSIIGAEDRGAKPERPNPVGVLLEASELAELDKAAAELGVSRHALLQYAIRQFLANWRKGKKPRITTREVKSLEPD